MRGLLIKIFIKLLEHRNLYELALDDNSILSGRSFDLPTHVY